MSVYEKKTVARGLGDGQTWQDVVVNRSASINYINDTGRTIMVTLSATQASAELSFYIDGVIVARQNASDNQYVVWGMKYGSITVAVPNGSSYKANLNTQYWWELR